MEKADSGGEMTASERISEQISNLPDWRGNVLAELRRVIHEADPDIDEEWKWGTSVWAKGSDVCSAAAFKDHVKLNFFKGASLKDSNGLFNAGLEGKKSRAIDFLEGQKINEAALKELILEAVRLNRSGDHK